MDAARLMEEKSTTVKGTCKKNGSQPEITPLKHSSNLSTFTKRIHLTLTAHSLLCFLTDSQLLPAQTRKETVLPGKCASQKLQLLCQRYNSILTDIKHKLQVPSIFQKHSCPVTSWSLKLHVQELLKQLLGKFLNFSRTYNVFKILLSKWTMIWNNVYGFQTTQ